MHEYEEFDLYNLNEETFKRFYLYLRKEGLLDKNIPKLLKEETKFHEENISKQLYKDYSTFKNKFFENIVKNNPEHNKLLLFKKSQKFLDRILFVLFAEDKELIPTNAISRIVESWVLADDLHYKPLYELFTILFQHLNVGHTYKSGYEIPAYNGGLFAPDDILDNLKVDDKILKDDLLTLSKYDFNTDVDVNILGHIFEHSLSEIEEIEAEPTGADGPIEPVPMAPILPPVKPEDIITNNETPETRVDNWKRKLLDLTKRNRLLNLSSNAVAIKMK